ncbi:hypothetical protein [Bacillus sp. B15-48]|uniref:YfjL-like protein n=1 Tax=Bacillus sp. B15-48 TaxID=1548601 RepID=UPI00193F24DA|nr:hypothetical protein [Bacillus sp. B15-48]MBM4764568.1 hypothetical protein [Bacillus sp. B15-48]
MKNRKKLLLKIIAGSLAIALIGGILFITNSFVGNPISASFANKTIKQYVEQNYSSLDLELQKASYNFKDGSYAARAESKTSIDTKFYIYYRDGEILRDDYETYVIGKFNTLQRLSDEYSVLAKNIVARELGFENNTTMVLYDKDEYENSNGVLELDMKFSRTLPMKAEVTIRLDLSDSSLEGIAKVLTDAHKAFINNDCIFNKYDLYAENDGMLIMVNGVTPADIESGELISRLEEAKNNDSVGGISVFIKD